MIFSNHNHNQYIPPIKNKSIGGNIKHNTPNEITNIFKIQAIEGNTNNIRQVPNIPKLGKPRQYVKIHLLEKQQSIGGNLSELLSEEQKQQIISLGNNADEDHLKPILPLIRLAIRIGKIKKPSQVLEETTCIYYNGCFSDGDGSAFCAIGALAYEYFGWDGKSQLSSTDKKNYVHMPRWMRIILKDMLSKDVFDHLMLINDGSFYSHSNNVGGFVPAINYLKENGI